MSFLVDTNILSELRKRSPNRHVARWFATAAANELFVSVLTVGEIRQGITRLERRDLDRARVFDNWLGRLVSAYGDHVVPVTVDIAEEWGRLNALDPLPVVDGLLAATARVRDWTLVTRNTVDVARLGVRLLNPFEPAG